MSSSNESYRPGPALRRPIIGLCAAFVLGTWVGAALWRVVPQAVVFLASAFGVLFCLWTACRVREGRIVSKVSGAAVMPSVRSILLVHAMVIVAAGINAAVCWQGAAVCSLDRAGPAGARQAARSRCIGLPDPVARKAAEWQRGAVRLLTAGIDEFEEESAIVASLTVGRRRSGARDLFRVFARTGTLHVFAISGAHVMALATVMASGLKSMRVPRQFWVVVVSPAIAVYALITGMQPSALRACIMSATYLAAPLLGRKPDAFAALAASAIVILGMSPGSLMMPGFQLSFLAMLGILVLYPVCAVFLPGRIADDPLRADPEPFWKLAMARGFNAVHKLFAVSLAAWLATAPMTALYFGLVSPIGLLGNLIAIPCASLMILTGCLSFVSALVHPWLPVVFNHANVVFAGVLSRSMKVLAAVPFGCIETPHVPVWIVVCYYVLLALAVFEWRMRRPGAQA